MPQEEETKKKIRVELCLFALTRGVDLRFLMVFLLNWSGKLAEEIPQTAVFVFCFSLCMKENTGVVSRGDIFLQKEDRAALKAERIMCVKVESERRKKEAGGGKTGKQGVRQIQVLNSTADKKKNVLQCVDSIQSINTVVF